MDFSWTDEQLELRQRMVELGESLNEDVSDHDRAGRFSREKWDACAHAGVQGLFVDESHSGSPAVDLVTALLAMEGLGYGCEDAGLCLGLNAHMWTVQLPIQEFGTDEQKERFLPDLASGRKIGVHAITEKTAGSDVYSLQTTAVPSEGGYVLNGTKRFITLGPVADVALVFATINPELRKWGLTAFLVESSFDGFAASEPHEKMGLRTAPFGEITLTDCFVPESHRIAPEGAGFSISNHALEFERCCILSSQIGTMQRQLETTIEYARKREQFGRPISRFQSVSNRIVDMKLRLETARLLMYKVAWLKVNKQPAMLEAALLKLHLSECFLESSLDAVRVHGGAGYLTETGIERDVRDAVGGVIYAGTSDIQRGIVAKLLGL